MSLGAELKQDSENVRVGNVRSLAARMAKFSEGKSVRECLDALALASGALIRSCFNGPARATAVQHYVDALMRAVNKPQG